MRLNKRRVQKGLQPEFEKLVLRQAPAKWGTTTLALEPRVLILLVTGDVLFASKTALNMHVSVLHAVVAFSVGTVRSKSCSMN
jgi:hypothetical protein